jgi:phosphoenolpyruvate carboxylase
VPPQHALTDDIRLLGRMLGDVIADQAGVATLDLVEAIRRAAVGCSTRCRSPMRCT